MPTAKSWRSEEVGTILRFEITSQVIYKLLTRYLIYLFLQKVKPSLKYLDNFHVVTPKASPKLVQS